MPISIFEMGILLKINFGGGAQVTASAGVRVRRTAAGVGLRGLGTLQVVPVVEHGSTEFPAFPATDP
jgi:hypothetical protein